MSSLGDMGGQMGGGGVNKNMVMEQVKNQIAVANAQELLQVNTFTLCYL